MANAAEELSADEIALYDRQLRLWGIEAQNRMRKAKVLLITIRALGNEVAKNLVLAGIGSLTVVDSGQVSEKDVSSQFFVTSEDIGKNVCLWLEMADIGSSAQRLLWRKSGVSIQEFMFTPIQLQLLRRKYLSSGTLTL
jgi:molybdopterin/thiamine biosynthesis adenylyltransferase